jgi:hypothetical protein
MTDTRRFRTRISLDGPWEFVLDPDQQLSPDTLDDGSDQRTITVPGPWQAQFDDLRDYSGTAWYRRIFELNNVADGADQGSGAATPFIHFGAVDYHTTVWLNGQCLGAHEGGYLPFEFDLGGAVRVDGPNELILRVIDPSSDTSRYPEYPFAEIPHGKQSWYGPIGGIWQSVYLEMRHLVHITRIQVTPDVSKEQAHVLVQLSQPGAEPYTLVLTLIDPQGRATDRQITMAVGEYVANVSLSIPEAMLWDTDTPQLYSLTVALHSSNNETPWDVLSTAFGMRSITTSPEGFLVLNGRLLYLRGALDQDYYPQGIYTPFSDAELDDQFAKAKHMGLNCLRTHIKITDPRYYDAADRAGILIWTELPNWEHLSEAAKRRVHETLTGMVERDWNHPSIIIWTIINEGWGVDLAHNADHRAWLAETYAYLKQLDPHRLIVGNSPCFTNFHVVTDIEDFHNYYAIPDHYRQWRDWVQAFAGRPPWTFAPSFESYESWRAFTRDPWNAAPRSYAPEVQRRGNEPMVISEFGNWGLPDVGLLRECYGGMEPWWFETGIEWGEGTVYPHAVELRYKAYHLDKVFPTFSDLAAASQRMQFTALKYQIEQLRRYPSIVGYIITEFTDVHWECNGLLDMCRNPKAFYDVIADVNSADVIVPDWERIVFWEGERCEIQLALSHFSNAPLVGSRLEWHVDLWPEIGGAFTDLQPAPGAVTPIGMLRFEAPAPAKSERARIELRLLDANGALVTSNHHEIYVFPRRLGRPRMGTKQPLRLCAPGSPALAEQLTAVGYELTDDLSAADVVVVETMTDEIRWYVQQGGRVLWLAESAEALQTSLSGISIAQRRGRSWQGDWASNFNWIRQDQMFQDIPTGGVVDFAFADLTPDYVIAGVKPRDFAADVHAGLFVGWLHHTVALIAERRFGKGRLLISTFRLCERMPNNPVAMIMVNDMIERLGVRG